MTDTKPHEERPAFLEKPVKGVRDFIENYVQVRTYLTQRLADLEAENSRSREDFRNYRTKVGKALLTISENIQGLRTYTDEQFAERDEKLGEIERQIDELLSFDFSDSPESSVSSTDIATSTDTPSRLATHEIDVEDSTPAPTETKTFSQRYFKPIYNWFMVDPRTVVAPSTSTPPSPSSPTGSSVS